MSWAARAAALWILTCLAWLPGCGRTGLWELLADSGAPDIQQPDLTLPDAFIARDAPWEPYWLVRAGGPMGDGPMGLAADPSGEVTVTGGFSATATFGPAKLTANKGLDIFVTRLDRTGRFLWSTAATGASARDMGTGVGLLPGGAAVIHGVQDGPVKFGYYTRKNGALNDMFAVQVDIKGGFGWFHGGPTLSEPGGVVTDAAGNSYHVCTFWGTFTTGWNKRLPQFGLWDLAVFKLDPKGKLLWAVSAGSVYADWGRSIALGPGDTVTITGSIETGASFGVHKVKPVGHNDIFVAQLDGKTGKFLWATGGGGKFDDDGGAVAVDPRGDITIAGRTRGDMILGPVKLTGGPGAFVARLDSKGRFRWARLLPGGKKTELNFMLATPGYRVLTGGSFQETISAGGHTLTSRGLDDAFILELDSAGKVVRALSAGGKGLDNVTAAAVDTRGVLYLAGGFFSTAAFGGRTLTSRGYSDIFIWKLPPTWR